MSNTDYCGDPGNDASLQSCAGYLANTHFVDEGIGSILTFLQERNLMEDFMIVWTSDHGDMNGDHYLWRKCYPWEGSSHIPLIIS